VSIAARGLVSDVRGLSLRFPRFIRIRDDKALEHASTPAFLATMYRDQQGKGKEAGGVDDFELMDGALVESEAEAEDEEEDEVDHN
jgi:DNA ligase-1